MNQIWELAMLSETRDATGPSLFLFPAQSCLSSRDWGSPWVLCAARTGYKWTHSPRQCGRTDGLLLSKLDAAPGLGPDPSLRLIYLAFIRPLWVHSLLHEICQLPA